jgi:hypothetical protein
MLYPRMVVINITIVRSYKQQGAEWMQLIGNIFMHMNDVILSITRYPTYRSKEIL